MCQNPLVIRSRLVPCGKCDECIKRKWKFLLSRINGEFQSSYCTLMLTLTYDDLHYGLRSKNDISKFFKLFRYYYPKAKFKYFWCIEQGEEKGREHYHILMFFSNQVRYELFKFKEIWNRGFIKVRQIRNSKRCAYTMKYIYKDSYKHKFPKGTRKFGSSANLGVKYFLHNSKFMDCLSTNTLGKYRYNVDQRLIASILKQKIKFKNFEFLTKYIETHIPILIVCNYYGSKELSSKSINEIRRFYNDKVLFKRVFPLDVVDYIDKYKFYGLIELYWEFIYRSMFSVHYCGDYKLLPHCYDPRIELHYDTKIGFNYICVE